MAEPIADRIARSQKGWLDPLSNFTESLVGGTFKLFGPLGRPLKDLLHGSVLLGHALHPVLTDVPVGAWTVAIVFDLISQVSTLIPKEAGDAAVAIGVIAALATVVTGYNDFYDTYGQERRVAMLHGLLMTLITIAYGLSALIRWRGGSHDLAVWIAVVAYLALTLTAYLGGHMVFEKGTMVNRNAFRSGPKSFKAAGLTTDFPEGEMRRVDVSGSPVLVTRMDGKLCAIGAVCSHAGGHLEKGKLNGRIVTCPLHGSLFDVCTGQLHGGPATIAQPVYEAREEDGTVEIRQLTPVPD